MGGAGTQQLLERIVEQLEQSPLSITTKCAQVYTLQSFLFLSVEACTINNAVQVPPTVKL